MGKTCKYLDFVLARNGWSYGKTDEGRLFVEHWNMLSWGWNVTTRAAPSWWHVNLGTTYLNVPLATVHHLYNVDVGWLLMLVIWCWLVMLAADAGDMMLLQLMASPQLLSTGVFVTVLRMLVIMCASCPDLAVMLLKQSTLSCFFIIVYNSAQIKWLTLGPLFLNFHVK